MAKKNGNAITGTENITDEENVNPGAVEATTEEKKRIRRSKKEIMFAKLDAFYGKYEDPLVCARLQEVKDAITELDKMASKLKTSTFSIKKYTRGMSQEALFALAKEIEDMAMSKTE